MKKYRYDGIDHINIFSKGTTKLGQLLSNFACTPFTHWKFGKFDSVEGFWYWLGTRDDKLRGLWGYDAKKYGQSIDKKLFKELPTKVFRKYIRQAIAAKINQNHLLKQLLIDSVLPFDHYYLYGGIKTALPQYKWIVDWIEQQREYWKEHN